MTQARRFTARLKSLAPLLYGAPYIHQEGMFIEDPEVSLEELRTIERTDKDRYERLTWRNRLHTHEGKVLLPACWFRLGLAYAAQNKSEKIPGKGHMTYTRQFRSGVLCTTVGVVLNLDPKKVKASPRYVSSNGKATGGKVWRHFPILDSWEGDLELTVINPLIPDEKVEEYLKDAGMICGAGSHRPQTGGEHGRYSLASLEVEKL